MKINFKNADHQDPERMHGMKVDYAPAKRKVPKWRLYLIILIVFSPFIALAYRFSSGMLFVHATGFVDLEFHDITSSQDGNIKKINVIEGQQVKENQVLLELTNPELEAKLDKIKLKIKDFENSIPSDEKNTGISPLETQKQAALENLEFREAHYKKMLFLFEHKAATSTELNIARMEMLKAQVQLGEVLSRVGQDSKSSVQWKRQELELEKQSLKQQVNALKIRSPGPGTVLSIYKSLNDALSKGTSVMMLNLDLTPEEHEITTYLDPKYIQYAVVGNKVIVVFPDGSKIKARISAVEGLTQKMPLNLFRDLQVENKVFLVLKITLPSACKYAISGLPVTVYFNSYLTCLTDKCPGGKLKKWLQNLWKHKEVDTVLSPEKNTNVTIGK